MKKSLLFAILIISSFSAFSQDYCLYNSQKSINLGDNYFDEPYEIMEQPDGKFLIFGTGYTIATNSFHIVGARVFPNGNLDPAFGNLGKVDYIFDQRNSAICMVLQADGKILIGGYQAPSNGVSGFKPYVVRLNNDGSVDTDFGDGGSALVPYANTYPGVVKAIKSYSDGSISVICDHTSGLGYTFAKLLSNGQPDLDFGIGGYTHYNLPFFTPFFDNPAGHILADSSFLAMSYVYIGGNAYINLTKALPDGSLDEDFGDGGFNNILNIVSNGNELRSAIDFDGNILVSSRTTDYLPFILKVDVETGELMSEFGTDGILYAPIESIGLINFQFVKDWENQEWILVFGDNSDAIGTMRINSNGDILSDCSAQFYIPDLDATGTQSYTCGIVDSQGVLRLSGLTGVTDVNSTWETQNMNFMWPYYVPPSEDPAIISVNPDQIMNGTAIELNVSGYGLSDVQDLSLITGVEILDQSSFEIINDEEIQVVFYPETLPLGLMDLEVYRTNDTLVLIDAVEIIGEEVIDGKVNILSRTRILAGGQTLYTASFKNKGTSAMIATPIVIINTDPYTMDFTNQPKYDLQSDTSMTSFVDYLNSQGIDPIILNESGFQDEGNQNHAFLTSNLSPSASRNIGGMSSIDDPVLAPQFVYLHPNPIVGNEGLLESYIPEPGNCMQEIVLSALLTAVPSVDVTNYESCFNTAYSQMQSDLANIARNINDERLIPFKGAMMRLLFDMMTCIDDSYMLSQTEMELFNAEMAVLFATDVILDEDFPCESYAEASTYYHGLIEAPSDDIQTNAFDKSDPWGIGINFNACYGCQTMNEIEGASSLDPNEKIGPSQQFGGTFINNRDMFYSIHFENVDSADIAAKTVYIVDSLDMEKLELSSFKFTTASWGENVVTLSGNSDVTEIDLRPEVPNILRITTNLDEVTGVATWRFETLDTLSLYPTQDIDQGFLPPNVTAPEGMGFVGFEVLLKEDIESGSIIENNALIFFDFNDPIVTNNWINTFDNEVPASHVNEITDYSAGENVVNINWETDEPDPNILFYNIYYNTDASDDWIPWLSQTIDIESAFTGELGMTYYFISVAVDSAFNVEEYADVYDAFVYMNPVGIEEIDDNSSVQIYPNPASEQFLLLSENLELERVGIYNNIGQEVYSQKLNVGVSQHMVFIESLEAGIYFIECVDKHNRVIAKKKLMKQ